MIVRLTSGFHELTLLSSDFVFQIYKSGSQLNQSLVMQTLCCSKSKLDVGQGRKAQLEFVLISRSIILRHSLENYITIIVLLFEFAISEFLQDSLVLEISYSTLLSIISKYYHVKTSLEWSKAQVDIFENL